MYLFLSLFCPVTFSPRLIRADQVRCAKTEHFTPATDTFCDPPQQKLHFPRKISRKTSAGSTEARGGIVTNCGPSAPCSSTLATFDPRPPVRIATSSPLRSHTYFCMYVLNSCLVRTVPSYYSLSVPIYLPPRVPVASPPFRIAINLSLAVVVVEKHPTRSPYGTTSPAVSVSHFM